MERRKYSANSLLLLVLCGKETIIRLIVFTTRSLTGIHLILSLSFISSHTKFQESATEKATAPFGEALYFNNSVAIYAYLKSSVTTLLPYLGSLH